MRNLEAENEYVFFVTRMGTVKKTALKDFCNVMSRGIIAIGIDKEDELVAAQITDGNQIIFLASHEGMAIRFDEEDVRIMGRPAYGVRGMDLGKKDYIVGMAVTPKENKKSKRGDGKSDDIGRILCRHRERLWKTHRRRRVPSQTRGGDGVINVKTTKTRSATGRRHHAGDGSSEVMVISQFGKILRTDTEQIRAAGRSTQGVKLLNLEAGDRVAAAVGIPGEDEEPTETPTLIE